MNSLQKNLHTDKPGMISSFRRNHPELRIIAFALMFLTGVYFVGASSWYFKSVWDVTWLRDLNLHDWLWALTLPLQAVCVWFNWAKMPGSTRRKVYHTVLIGFGIIGMWLWLPTDREMDR